jgi:hypothetical protein
MILQPIHAWKSHNTALAVVYLPFVTDPNARIGTVWHRCPACGRVGQLENFTDFICPFCGHLLKIVIWMEQEFKEIAADVEAGWKAMFPDDDDGSDGD